MAEFLTKNQIEAAIKEMKNPSFSIKPREGRQVSKEVVTEVMNRYGEEKEVKFYPSTTTIQFGKKMHEAYCIYREKNMELDDELIEGTLSVSDINFKHQVIGSDETGTGEIFKPIVVAATYIKDVEQLRKCICLGIDDSKVIGEEKLNIIGRTITEIKNWEDIKEKAENQEVIASDFWAIRIITNKELNAACKENNENIDGVKQTLLKKAHIQVLEELSAKYSEAIIVVDDFMDTNNKNYNKEAAGKEFKENLKQDTYLTTKGDAKVMAIALASDISSYLSNLGFQYAEREFKKLTNQTKLPKGSPSAKELVNLLKEIESEKLEVFLDNYAKKYFSNVKNAINDIKK